MGFFQKAIKEKHGTTRGYIGSTVENLIELYQYNPDISVAILENLVVNELEYKISNNDTNELNKKDIQLKQELEKYL